MALTIFHSPRSRSQRVVWLCEEMNVPYVVTPASFMRPSPELLAANPLGTLPAITDGDVAMGESIAIMLYIMEKYGPTSLALKPADAGYPQYLQFLIYGEASLASMANPLIATQFAAPESQRTNWTAASMTRAYVRRLDYLAQRVAVAPYIAGDRFTSADISVAFAIGLAATLGVVRNVSPTLFDYYGRVTSRPAFERAMRA